MRYEVTTNWTPEEVIEYALNYFGPGNTGLEVTSKTSQGLVLQGGGGYVAIQIQPATRTTVDIETREWDYPVRQFMARLGRRRLSQPRWWSTWWRRLTKGKSSTPAAEVQETKPQAPIFTILNNQDRNDPLH